MDIKFTRARWSLDAAGTWLSLLVDPDDVKRARKFAATMSDKPHTAGLKLYRPRRSVDANAYFWIICGKLAAKLGMSPNEVYRQYIPDVADNYVIWPVKEELREQIARMWCDGHIGRVAEDLGPCRNTPGYHNLRCYIGSSDYDTAQMSRLVKMIVEDCKEQGIETKTPDELAALMEGYAQADKGAPTDGEGQGGGL